VDKAGLVIAGETLLDRVLAATCDASRVAVVGPPRAVDLPVRWCREDPPGSGPVAAVAAGLLETSADTVVLLATDLPWIARAVDRLRTALEGAPAADAAVLVDATGRRNYLAAAWRRAALLAALQRLPTHVDAAMGELYRHGTIVDVPDPDGAGFDCDTWDEVDLARRMIAPGAIDDRRPT
jgi:molybdopterin-guanine dinucleotide biosynthesis protein A